MRVVKESFATDPSSDGDSRVALYVYPGDFERRGLVRNGTTYSAYVGSAPGDAGTVVQTETQYLVAGARVVWQHGVDESVFGAREDRNHRVTIPVSDLLHTTSASVDLRSGELLEVSTYYPNGARETLLTEGSYGEGGSSAGAIVPVEPMGFTGKEADEDVGLVYFGARYLVSRLGRWASPDPLAIQANGGGQILNSFHYVGGNLAQARDAVGLEWSEWSTEGLEGAPEPMMARDNLTPGNGSPDMDFALVDGPLSPDGSGQCRSSPDANPYLINPPRQLPVQMSTTVTGRTRSPGRG